MTIYRTCGAIAFSLVVAAVANGQTAAPADQPVSRQEFEDLKKDNVELRKELQDVKKNTTDQGTIQVQDESDQEQMEKTLRQAIAAGKPGTEGLVIAGDAAFGFTSQKGTDSTFSADVSPLILWQPPDSRFLIESAFDFAFGGTPGTGDGTGQSTESASLDVALADISYEVNDDIIVGAGLFAVPFGVFHNHFDPPWIYKFPDEPLVFGDSGLAPSSEVGIFLKGVLPIGDARITYDGYVANGPNLITDDAGAAGMLNFNDYTDLNSGKALGGRIAFRPIPELEAGYSIEAGRVSPSGFANTSAVMHAVDFNYRPDIKAIGGVIDFRAEWIWSHVGTATYDPTGSMGFGPVTFKNNRNGGYVQLGYRPTHSDNSIIRSMEFLVRYDTLITPVESPGGDHETRYSLCLDYWFTPQIVLQTEYEIDHKNLNPSQNAFIIQLGVGL